MDENMAGKEKEAAKSDKKFSRSNPPPPPPPPPPPSSFRLSTDETNVQNSMQSSTKLWKSAASGPGIITKTNSRLSRLSNPSLLHEEQVRLQRENHEKIGVAIREQLEAGDLIEDPRRSQLHGFAIKDEWNPAKSICDEDPDIVSTPLTANGDRVLHIAVSANSVNFVEGLVKLVRMTPQDLGIQNNDGNTAFCVAAISGNARFLQIMMGKNDNLPLISGQDGMLPVHLAASAGHHEIVDLLSSDDLLGKMKDNDIQRLFLMTISNDIFYVAIKLFQKYHDLLAITRSSALHSLARKPSGLSSVDCAGMKLFKEVWSHVRQSEYNKMLRMKLFREVLFDAIQFGNDGAARWILTENPGLLTLKGPRERSLLHYAVLYRQESVLRYILKQGTANLMIRAVDSERNNVLHLAASYQSHEALSRLDTKMQRELAWFKEVKDCLPTGLRTMKNSKDQTPEDVFNASHRELSKEVKHTAKGIAQSGMLVAALIATVAFAAALTVPGDKTSAWFVVFILTNAAALFASSASLISFLSIFTSAWLTDNEFNISQTLIKLGLVLLVVSVVSMVVSFAAASFLIFGHIFKWVAYVVVSMGVLPILLLLVLRSKYVDRLLTSFDRLHNYFSWSRISCHVKINYRTIFQQISACNFKSSKTAEDMV